MSEQLGLTKTVTIMVAFRAIRRLSSGKDKG